MDGVLAAVGTSYREAILKTRHFGVDLSGKISQLRRRKANATTTGCSARGWD
jgi:hypothetical protein